MSTPPRIEWLITWLQERTGIHIRPDQHYLITTRLTPIAAGSSLTLDGLIDAVKAGNLTLRQNVIDALTTNETSWMRDPTMFADLGNQIFPQLIEDAAPRRTLSIWSAACSTGQELYSLAMMLADKPQIAGWTLNLDGSDISSRVVDKAKSGRYSQLEVDRGLPARQMITRFTQEGLDWVLADDIKNMCNFRTANLLDPPSRRGYDLILARYVLIYFTPEDRRKVLANLAKALRPGGMLIIGGSEIAHDAQGTFTSTTIGRTNVYTPLANQPASTRGARP